VLKVRRIRIKGGHKSNWIDLACIQIVIMARRKKHERFLPLYLRKQIAIVVGWTTQALETNYGILRVKTPPDL